MKRKKYLFLTGAVVILFGLTAVLFLSIRDQPDPGRKPETRSEEEVSDEKTTQSRGQTTEASIIENFIEVHGTGRLYYLDPEGGQDFQKRLTDFVKDQGIEAESAEVLEYCIDDREKEKDPAQFFLELDDDRHTIVRVSFKKATGTYRFDLYDGPLPQGSRETGAEEKEYIIPESTEDVTVPESRLSITDPEGRLEEAADMEELKNEFEEFLRSKEEGRRNFYVSSVTVTGKKYKAVLCFETVRQDGRNVEIRYDGKYHFRFV